jgi:hypothetical protein
MTRFGHDIFAKDALEAFLSPWGEAIPQMPVQSEVRYIDLYFTPTDASVDVPMLGLLWKCAATGAAFEAFRCAVQDDEVRSTMGKLFNVHEEITRIAKQQDLPVPKTADLPRLWIITPTMSKKKLKAINVITEESEWGAGIYLLSEMQRTGIIVVHHLLKTPDTVWFRILGRGKVQQGAIDEIEALPANSPYRNETLKLFVKLKVTLENRNDREQNETELMMRLADSPLFTEYMQRATADAVTTAVTAAVATAVKSGHQEVVEGFLLKRFGSLDDDLIQVIPNIIKLSPLEFTSLLIDLSREELIDRFSNND